MTTLISTIVLNWNRLWLLKTTIESYLDTISSDGHTELLIVDNGSTDGSRDYLRELEKTRPARVIYLAENIGGEAFNSALPFARGALVHLSENDQEFLPGWLDHARQSFAAFADLGQLSLFSHIPSDEEAWEPKPAMLRFAGRKILYEAALNVTTSSVLRAELFRERGLRVSNIEGGSFKFPNDEKLSADVKAAGYWVAWSDRYYVRNRGHEAAEFEAHPRYYEEDYASKPWVGLEGWRARIDQQKRLPKAPRRSIVFPDLPPLPEKTPQPVYGRPSRLWSMFDGFTAETEVIDFLHALVRLVKPERVLETGTWIGLSSCSIAAALAANGFGRLTTLEVNPDAHRWALENLKRHGVEAWVDALLLSSLEFTPSEKIDLALFDSELELRGPEFDRFEPWLSERAVIVFHDTAAHFPFVGDALKALLEGGRIVGFDLPTPRGIFIGRPVSPPHLGEDSALPARPDPEERGKRLSFLRKLIQPRKDRGKSRS